MGAEVGGATLRVVIVDDEYLVREGARSVLSGVAGIEVAGTAGDPEELMAMVDDVRPDVVLLDIKMSPTHRAEGIEAARQLRASTRRSASSSCPSTPTPSTPWNCSATAPGAWPTCSRNGSAGPRSWSRRSTRWPRAARPWTPRWWTP